MPDEYLPPNPILFVQNLPDEITKEGLEKLFAPYVSCFAFCGSGSGTDN